ncbi:tape measure protein [Kiloniella majae]|uniref:tape measure protein n=1 Tax=Kiloniella majae TaxID=1938558 RepID=UPI000A277FAE|nr:tape measure protein [Kiloniella majae]
MSEIERLIWQIEAKTEGMRRELKKAEQSGEKFTRKMDQTVSRTNSQFAGLGRVLSGAVVPALGAVAGALSIQQIYRYAEAWKQTENRLKLVTNGTAELTATQNSLFSVAQNTRSSFESTADLYSRVARSTEELNLSQSKLIELTTIVNQASRISGGGVQEAAAAVQQFGQALQSDRLQGDELRSILENAPRLAKALADGLGVSVGELRALGAEGTLTADKIVNALSTQSQALQEEFEKIEKTGAEALTQLDNAFLRLISTMDKATGASSVFSDIVGRFASGVEIASLDDHELSLEALQRRAELVGNEINRLNELSFLPNSAESLKAATRGLEYLKKLISAAKGEISATPIEIRASFEIDSLRSERDELIQLIEQMEERASRFDLSALSDTDNGALQTLKDDLSRVNDELEKLSSSLSYGLGDIENQAIGYTPKKEKPPSKEELREAEAIKRKTEALQFQFEQLGRNERQQFLYNQLNEAGIDINHESANSIINVANAVFDLTKKQENLEKAKKDKKEADAELEQQNKAVKDVEQEIANIEREVQALLQGKEAYEAYQQAREIEQGSEAIRERLEALGLEEEQINRLIEAYERHSEELDKAEETFKKREEAVERQKQSEQELADILENGIGRSLSAAADGWDALGKVALDVLGQILAESLKLEDVLSSSGGSGGGGAGLLGGLLGGIGSGLAKLIPGFADGGRIRGPGGPRSDSLLAKVSNNEFIVNAAATSKNLPLLEAINSGSLPAFADGGFVGGSVPRVPDISKSMQTINNSNRSSSNSSVVYNIDARGAEVGVEQKIKQALDEREPVIIEGAVQQVREESYRSGSSYLGGG